MSTRYWTAASLLLWVGCSGGDTTPPKDEPPADTDTDTDADTDTGDSMVPTVETASTADTGSRVVPPGVIDWNTLSFGFQMGYDQTTRQPVSVFLDLGTGPFEIAPTLDLILGDTNWTGNLADVSEYCTVSLPLTNASLDTAFAASDPRLIAGFIQNPTELAYNDCFDGREGELDPSYGTAFDLLLQSYGEWGVAIGQTEAVTESLVNPYLYAPLGPAQLLGGTVRMGAYFAPPDVVEVFGFGYEIDSAFDVVTDDAFVPVVLPFSAVSPGPGMLAPGWYSVTSLYVYSFY